MKNGHYEGSDIKPLTEKERRGINRESFKVAASKHRLGFEHLSGFDAGKKGSK